MMNRRFFSRFISVAVLAVISLSTAQARQPNILLIVGDDMGYGDIGVHGAKDIQTPAIDSLARNGVRFTNGYVTGPYCSPTRAALLTGRYQQRYGHEFNPGPAQSAEKEVGLSLTETTLADRLKTAGYRTGLVGKWHLGYQPTFHPLKRGFQEFFGFLGGSHSYLDAKADSANPILRGTQPVDETEYLTDAFGREALSFIDRHKADSWFLFLSFNAVHGPLQGAPKYLERYKNIQDERRRTYAAMMAAMDDAIAAVLRKLNELKLEEETLVFFISDNGGPPVNASSNDPLRGTKAETWEGGIRVPFLLQWKGRIPPAKIHDHPVIQLDIVPTALAAAGVAVQSDWKLDGVNLLPYVLGEKQEPPHEALYWRFGQQMAIRMGDWKLVKAPENRDSDVRRRRSEADPPSPSGAQLFNLAKDIGEKTNLAAQEPERVRNLESAWEKWNSELEAPRWYPGQRRRRN